MLPRIELGWIQPYLSASTGKEMSQATSQYLSTVCTVGILIAYLLSTYPMAAIIGTHLSCKALTMTAAQHRTAGMYAHLTGMCLRFQIYNTNTISCGLLGIWVYTSNYTLHDGLITQLSVLHNVSTHEHIS